MVGHGIPPSRPVRRPSSAPSSTSATWPRAVAGLLKSTTFRDDDQGMTIRKTLFGALAVLLLAPPLVLSLGSTVASASAPTGPTGPTTPTATNFWLATATGNVYAFGGANALGSP